MIKEQSLALTELNFLILVGTMWEGMTSYTYLEEHINLIRGSMGTQGAESKDFNFHTRFTIAQSVQNYVVQVGHGKFKMICWQGFPLNLVEIRTKLSLVIQTVH